MLTIKILFTINLLEKKKKLFIQNTIIIIMIIIIIIIIVIVVVRGKQEYSRTLTGYILPIFVKCLIRIYIIVTYARYRQQSRKIIKFEDL